MKDRMEVELEMLRTRFPDLEVLDHWIKFPGYPVSDALWLSGPSMTVCFPIPDGYPGQKPYGFYVSPPPKLRSGGEVKNSTVATEPPFGGEWLKFSWDMPDWKALADPGGGYNLLNWALSFGKRLEEGS
jgi:hypothetical protein